MADFFARFLDSSNGLTLLFVPIKESADNAGSALLQTLIGGLITLAAACLTFWLTARHERQVRATEQSKLAAADAISGYHKICRWVDILGNMKGLMDTAYQEAHRNELFAGEPFQTVPPFAGRFLEPPPLESREFSFLLSPNNFDLVNDVVDLERKAANLVKLLDEFSLRKDRFEDWIHSLPGIDSKIDGPIAEAVVPSEHSAAYSVKGAQMNRILAGIFEQLDEEVPKVQRTLVRFVEAAHEHFGKHFPKIEIVFEQERNPSEQDA